MPSLSLPQIEQQFTWRAGLCLSCSGMTPVPVTCLGTLRTVLGPLPVHMCKWCLTYRAQDLIKQNLVKEPEP